MSSKQERDLSHQSRREPYLMTAREKPVSSKQERNISHQSRRETYFIGPGFEPHKVPGFEKGKRRKGKCNGHEKLQKKEKEKEENVTTTTTTTTLLA